MRSRLREKQIEVRITVAASALFFLLAAPCAAQRAVIVVRHAEKANAPADNPPLTAAGTARAKRLASMLRDAGVRAIYSTGFVRTMKTAEPLSKALHLPIEPMPSTVDEFVATVRKAHADEVVLVVGHTNTVPEILQKFGYDQTITIPDGEYDNLFVVSPGIAGGAPTVVRLRY